MSKQGGACGLGLYLIRSFLTTNEGEFRIYANNGAMIETNATRKKERLFSPVQGTLIDMRIIIRDDIKYVLSSEEEI